MNYDPRLSCEIACANLKMIRRLGDVVLRYHNGNGVWLLMRNKRLHFRMDQDGGFGWIIRTRCGHFGGGLKGHGRFCVGIDGRRGCSDGFDGSAKVDCGYRILIFGEPLGWWGGQNSWWTPSAAAHTR